MTCYTRHLPWLFEALELEYDRPNRLRVDRAVRQVLDIGLDVPCGQVWAALKALPEADRASLAPRVQAALD